MQRERVAGDQIMKWQRACGFNQPEAAELCEVPYRTYQHWLAHGCKRAQLVEPLRILAERIAKQKAVAGPAKA